MDSGSYSELERIPGYDWIRESQIDWFREKASALPAKGAPPLPSLVFFHIPLPEYKEVWRTRRCDGRRFEDISCPKLNSGLFAALVEAGGVLGTFCGHDHINDFEGTLHGIRLTYGRSTGYHTYGRLGFKRGGKSDRIAGGRRAVRDLDQAGRRAEAVRAENPQASREAAVKKGISALACARHAAEGAALIGLLIRLDLGIRLADPLAPQRFGIQLAFAHGFAPRFF
ncbi:metallophosphoesterase family protein [Cohnella rhizosphaerae]|uniref:metallophosphoesterase family protein n=1 Tax=Cohnella rhizosphaerae TaxID=1457232 RepID=UPI0030B8757D